MRKQFIAMAGLRRVLPSLLQWLAVLALFGAGQAWAEIEPRLAEYNVKAAFLCKFGNFVEWPPDAFAAPDSAFAIGVVADDEVAAEITRAATGLTVDVRPIVVRRLQRGDSLAGVHLLFVARSHESQLADWLALARGQPVFVVTESPRGPALGSTLNFVIVEDRVRFDVLQPAEHSGLKISSRLLAVARKVLQRNPS